MLAATVGNALHDRPVETKVLLVYSPPAGGACVRACACVLALACVKRMNIVSVQLRRCFGLPARVHD